jgi:hypothetical protein
MLGSHNNASHIQKTKQAKANTCTTGHGTTKGVAPAQNSVGKGGMPAQNSMGKEVRQHRTAWGKGVLSMSVVIYYHLFMSTINLMSFRKTSVQKLKEEMASGDPPLAKSK